MDEEALVISLHGQLETDVAHVPSGHFTSEVWQLLKQRSLEVQCPLRGQRRVPVGHVHLLGSAAQERSQHRYGVAAGHVPVHRDASRGQRPSSQRSIGHGHSLYDETHAVRSFGHRSGAVVGHGHERRQVESRHLVVPTGQVALHWEATSAQPFAHLTGVSAGHGHELAVSTHEPS